jgi:NADPH2:quinone reductase
MSGGFVAPAPGGPDVLQWRTLPDRDPGPGEVRIRHSAIGVNFIDIYYRSGLYPWPETPLIPGAEAAGVIEAIGPGVTDLQPGQAVAYVIPTGAYRETRVVAADRLVPLPAGIAPETAAGAMLKGLTAQYLVTACHPVAAGDTILVHAAAGGVGLLLGQWLAALGATAIGTAGGPDKVALARAHGYAHVIDYTAREFAPEVMELTDGRGCDAVFDSVGASTWRGSLSVLKPRGRFVNFGQSSGMITGFALSDLARGSLSAMRPVLFDYIAARPELLARAADLFAQLGSGRVKLDTLRRVPLREVAGLHADMEARRTTGASVLIP